MSKSVNTLIATLLLAGAGNAVAASSVDLSVTGLITPSACVPSLSSGVVELGKISVQDLHPDAITDLPAQTLQMSVVCEATTLVAIKGNDNREGTNLGGGTEYFGLGLTSADEKIGAMRVIFSATTADGVPVPWVASDDDGVTWKRANHLTRSNLMAVTDTATLLPLPMKEMSTTVTLKPIIAATQSLTLDESETIDGSITLALRYL